MKTKEIQTRANEIKLTTNDPGQMLGNYIAQALRRKWVEEFLDDDSGELKSLDRFELIANRGELITNDLLSEIQFYLQSGDISSVEISTQKREAMLEAKSFWQLWAVTAQFANKNHRILLYAVSIDTAIEIAIDYIELNFSGSFKIVQAKKYRSCIVVNDSITNDNDNNQCKFFYQVEIKTTIDNIDSYNTFIVNSQNVDTAMNAIANYVSKQLSEHSDNKAPDYSLTLESAVVIPCNATIDKEFSEAHLQNQ